MEKRREIPAPKPNAAARSDADRVLVRIDALGMKGEDAVEAAGLGRATYFRLKKYEASVGTVRKIEEWLVKEEGRRRKPSSPSRSEQDQLLAEWAELGEALLEADPAQFATTFAGLRRLVESVKIRRDAIHQMFRATPGNER